jgi:RNA polymerase sigma factor (TIGR02999 family)
MRQVLVNHAEMRNTVKRGGGRSQRSIDHTIAAPDLGVDAIEVLAIEQALRKLSQLDERKARVVEAKIFGGLRHEELAIVLGVSLSTVEGDWRLAKAWLARELSVRAEIVPEARRGGA